MPPPSQSSTETSSSTEREVLERIENSSVVDGDNLGNTRVDATDPDSEPSTTAATRTITTTPMATTTAVTTATRITTTIYINRHDFGNTSSNNNSRHSGLEQTQEGPDFLGLTPTFTDSNSSTSSPPPTSQSIERSNLPITEASIEGDNTVNSQVKRQQLLEAFLNKYNEWMKFQAMLDRLENNNNGQSNKESSQKESSWDDIFSAMDSDLDSSAHEFSRNLSASEVYFNCDDEGGYNTMVEDKKELGDNKVGNTQLLSKRGDHFHELSLEKLSELLFSPGMKYRGKIRIPGLRVRSTGMTAAIADSDDDADVEIDNMNNDDGSGEDNESSNRHHVRNNESSNDGSINNEASTMSSVRRNPICVSMNEDTYELVILERGKDALGNQYVLARHHAYGDEQCVHIHLSISNQDKSEEEVVLDKPWSSSVTTEGSRMLEIEYADGETVCKGYWNAIDCRLQGHVRQRVQVNEGVFHVSDVVTHVFTLYPCTHDFPLGRDYMVDGATLLREFADAANKHDVDLDGDGYSGVEDGNKAVHISFYPFEKDLLSTDTRALIALRRRTHTALMDSLHNYNDLFQHLDLDASKLLQLRRGLLACNAMQDFEFLDEKLNCLYQLRHVEWSRLLTAASMNGEQTCAEYRRRAALLDETYFETTDDRTKFLGRWSEAKFDLMSAHSEWNRAEILAANVSRLACIFNRSSTSSMAIYPASVYPVIAMCNRIYANYDCLESAYRRAEGRLPRVALMKSEIPTPLKKHNSNGVDGASFQEACCAICQTLLLVTEGDDIQQDVPLDPIYKLPCTHCFHGLCVQQWLHDNTSCPVCRFDLTTDFTTDVSPIKN